MTKATHFQIITVLRHMFEILAVFHKVGPSRPNLRVIDLVVFEL